MQFCLRQSRCEISSLHSTLTRLNKRIFDGDNLEKDHKATQDRIVQCKERLPFLQDDVEWVCIEGKPFKKFLHLEDVKTSLPLISLKSDQGVETSDIDGILNILHNFYQDLYAETHWMKYKNFSITFHHYPNWT